MQSGHPPRPASCASGPPSAPKGPGRQGASAPGPGTFMVHVSTTCRGTELQGAGVQEVREGSQPKSDSKPRPPVGKILGRDGGFGKSKIFGTRAMPLEAPAPSSPLRSGPCSRSSAAAGRGEGREESMATPSRPRLSQSTGRTMPTSCTSCRSSPTARRPAPQVTSAPRALLRRRWLLGSCSWRSISAKTPLAVGIRCLVPSERSHGSSSSNRKSTTNGILANKATTELRHGRPLPRGAALHREGSLGRLS
mmetsp:Transcript_51419/g.166743  ORF Transcript_51419/g.166743 Transcript_51419/m.166743 type:complete len:251 (+) Transcript_51419:1146-1898(+)